MPLSLLMSFVGSSADKDSISSLGRPHRITQNPYRAWGCERPLTWNIFNFHICRLKYHILLFGTLYLFE